MNQDTDTGGDVKRLTSLVGRMEHYALQCDEIHNNYVRSITHVVTAPVCGRDVNAMALARRYATPPGVV